MMKDEAMPESSEEVAAATSENMQAELHKKGAVLTKAWADLFSYLTKYQAELTVKENCVDIAEKEIETRKKQLEEMKPATPDSEELAKMQDEIHMKERQLTKAQSELTAKDQLLRRTQSDLTCNMEMLEMSRCEMLDKQNEVIRFKSDIERLKSELAIQREQVAIKDNLLKKLQSQLMKENEELKEQLELDRRALELERRSHELTKRSMREKERSGSRSSSNPVIEIPDSPPTLDLSVENEDFGLSNIISMTDSQTHPSSMSEPSRVSVGQDSALSNLTSSAMSGLQEFSSRLSGMAASTPSRDSSQWGRTPPRISPSPSKLGAMSQTFTSSLSHDSPATTTQSESDTFFPLSVEGMDDKSAVDTSNDAVTMETDSGPVPISGPISSISGEGSSGGGGGDGKWQFEESSTGAYQTLIIETETSWCRKCQKDIPRDANFKNHMLEHFSFPCAYCGKMFYKRSDRERHHLVHTGVRPFSCSVCEKSFKRKYELKKHLEKKHVDEVSDSLLDL